MITISQNPIIYILAVIALLFIILLVWNIKLTLKVKYLSVERDGKSTKDIIKNIQRDLKIIQVFKRDMEKYLSIMEKRVSKSVQGVHNVSFSAFAGLDSGGTQSFATTLVNEKGDGVIISTLHARDRVNVFTKAVTDFKSAQKLSTEEQASLTKAQDYCKL